MFPDAMLFENFNTLFSNVQDMPHLTCVFEVDESYKNVVKIKPGSSFSVEFDGHLINFTSQHSMVLYCGKSMVIVDHGLGHGRFDDLSLRFLRFPTVVCHV